MKTISIVIDWISIFIVYAIATILILCALIICIYILGAFFYTAWLALNQIIDVIKGVF